jgi:hypothetical protein
MKLSGIRLGNFKILDGKVVADLKRSLASLPVNKRIAAAKGKKNTVRVVKRGTT